MSAVLDMIEEYKKHKKRLYSKAQDYLDTGRIPQHRECMNEIHVCNMKILQLENNFTEVNEIEIKTYKE